MPAPAPPSPYPSFPPVPHRGERPEPGEAPPRLFSTYEMFQELMAVPRRSGTHVRGITGSRP